MTLRQFHTDSQEAGVYLYRSLKQASCTAATAPSPPNTRPHLLPSPQRRLYVTMLTNSHATVRSNLLIAPETSCLRVSWAKACGWWWWWEGVGGKGGVRRLRRYDMILEHITKKKTRTDPHVDSYTVSRSAPSSPQTPQSTIAEPHVSVGINRSAPSSSHPALKSFPEVVLQKPAAEEDKRAAIPRAQRLLSSTQLSLSLFLLAPTPTPPPSRSPLLTYPLFPSIPPRFRAPSFPSQSPRFLSANPSPASPPLALHVAVTPYFAPPYPAYPFVTSSIFRQYFAFCGTCN